MVKCRLTTFWICSESASVEEEFAILILGNLAKTHCDRGSTRLKAAYRIAGIMIMG
jgi:hypothetical protein